MASDTNVGYASLQVIPTIRGAGANLTGAITGPLSNAAQQAGRAAGNSIADGIANAEGRVRQASDKLARAREAEVAAVNKVAIEEAKLQELRDRGITGGSRWLAQSERVRQAQSRQQQATRGVTQTSEQLRRAQDDLTEANNRTEDGAEGAGNSLAGLGAKAKEALTSVKGLALVGGTLGATLMAGITGAMGNEVLNDKLAASLGASPALAKEYGDTAGRLYAQGLGENMEEVNGTIGLLANSFRTLGAEGEVSMDKAAERALNFSKTFDTDVTEAVSTVSNMISNGLVKDTTEGFDLLTASFQRVPAAMRDELPEILQEYGVNFHALGFTGEQAFNTLVQAADKGKFALDKTGDALKEFTIRGSDMSKASTDAYQAIGLDAEEMSRKIAAGGAGAQDALQQTARGLLNIENPADRANTAIALFGTPLEDLSVDQIPAFLEGLTGGENAMAGFSGATDRMGQTLNDNGMAKIEAFKRSVTVGFTTALGNSANWISKNSGLIKDLGIAAGIAAIAIGALALQQNIMAAGGVAAFFSRMVSLTKAWAAQQAILNVIMSANPIGIVVMAVAALVAGLVIAYRNSETFRNAVQAAWNGIKNVVAAVWGWLSTSVFPVFKTALKAVGDVALWLWQNAILPAWNGIKLAIGIAWTLIKGYFALWQIAIKAVGAVVMWLWNNVITPAFTAIKFVIALVWAAIQIYFNLWKLAIKALATVVMWLWNNVITPAFNAIGAVISAVWNGVISPVFGFFKSGIEVVGNVASWLWNNVMVPAWNGIGTAISSVWNGVISPIFGFFKAAFDTVGNAANWLWNEVMVPAWNGIKNAISTVWDFIRPILDNIGKGIQAVGTIASRVGDAMRNAFDGVVDVLKAPIHAVGKVLASIPGSILGVDIPGASTIKSWGETLQSLRTGGTIAGRSASGRFSGPGTGTSDSIFGVDDYGVPMVRVSAGEGVVNYAAMENGGAGIVAALNAGWRPTAAQMAALGLPGLATGGVVGEPYGLPTGTNISYGAPGFPGWVTKLGTEHGVKPSTYAGHQESDRNEPGYAPNPQHLNRGIDWSGPVDAMQKFADYLFSIAPSSPSLEQIIWQNPNTGKKVGWAGRSPDASGSYFASDYSGHQDHVHTRQSAAIGAAAPVKPDTKTDVPTYESPDLNNGTDGVNSQTPDVTGGNIGTNKGTDGASKTRLKTFKELGSDVGGILAGGIEETFDGLLPAWVWDPNKLIEGDDGSNVRTTDTTNGSKAGNKSINGGTVDNTPAPGIDPNKELKVPDAVKPKDQGAGNRKGADLYAYEIARAALAAGVGKKGATIGEATALVEAGNPLKMWANSKVPDSLKFPHDAVGSDGTSVGLFQQQQNGAWGTLADNMDPFRSAGLFYNALKKVSGWETMDPGAAAQAVQRSAFPGKYAQQMGAAEALLARTGLFDTGGIFQPGTLAYNDLNEPELVLKKHQWGVMDRNAKVVEAQVRQGAGGGGNKLADVVNIQGYTAEEISEEWRQYQWARTAGYGTSRHR